jgi:hypothetical protein
MTSFLVGLVVGGLIAWQIPQPSWATRLTEEIKAWLKTRK